MSSDEAAQFELNADAALIIRLRYWDDTARKLNTPVNNLVYLKKLTLNRLNK